MPRPTRTAILAVGLASSLAGASSPLPGQTMVDHLVYAAPDLAEGVRIIEELLGVTATPGGQHLGLGTRNYLVSLGDEVYLEIIGPDPDQPTPDRPRPFGIDDLTEPRLVTWAAKGTGLAGLTASAAAAGMELGEVMEMSRRKPDGSLLTWELTSPFAPRADGVVPFLIDWLDSTHPADELPAGPRLVDFRIEHPEPEVIRTALDAIGSGVVVVESREPGLVAWIRTPDAVVVLR